MTYLPGISRLFGLLALLGIVACVEGEEPIPPEINEENYGPCLDANSNLACREDEPYCDAYPSGGAAEFHVCVPACSEVADCPMPATGDATVQCVSDGCVLDCSMGETCPDDMECDPSGVCRWPL